jgi:hypothetical protein
MVIRRLRWFGPACRSAPVEDRRSVPGAGRGGHTVRWPRAASKSGNVTTMLERLEFVVDATHCPGGSAGLCRDLFALRNKPHQPQHSKKGDLFNPTS